MGASLPIISAKFGASYDAIKKRAQREDWLLPHKLQTRLAAQQEHIKAISGCSEVSRNVSSPSVSPSFWGVAETQKSYGTEDKKLAALAETWETRASSIREQVWRIGEQSIKGLDQRGVIVADAKDLKIVAGLMREATGMFKDQPAVSLSIFQNGGDEGFSTDEPTYDGFVSETTSEPDDWA